MKLLSPTLLAGLNRIALAQLAAHGHLSGRQLQALATAPSAASPAPKASLAPAAIGRPGPRPSLNRCCA